MRDDYCNYCIRDDDERDEKEIIGISPPSGVCRKDERKENQHQDVRLLSLHLSHRTASINDEKIEWFQIKWIPSSSTSKGSAQGSLTKRQYAKEISTISFHLHQKIAVKA